MNCDNYNDRALHHTLGNARPAQPYSRLGKNYSSRSLNPHAHKRAQFGEASCFSDSQDGIKWMKYVPHYATQDDMIKWKRLQFLPDEENY